MRTLIVLLTGLLLGALLGAVGMSVFSGERPRAVAAATHAPVRERDEDAVRGAPAPAMVEEAVAARSVSMAAETAIPAELDDAVESLGRRAPAAAGRGERVLRGRISDPRGEPMAGVLVRATRRGDLVPRPAEPARDATRPPPAESLEEKLRKTIAEHYRNGAEVVETRTDAQGRYELAQLRDGEWRLSVWQARHAFRNTRGGEGELDVRPDATIDWIARRKEARALAVLLPDGAAAPYARIEARRDGRDDVQTTLEWSRAQPEIELEPGAWEVRARLGHPREGPAFADYLGSEWSAFAVVADADDAPVELRLKTLRGLAGRVTLSNGDVPQQVVVRLEKLEAGQGVDVERLRSNAAPDALSDWIGDGRFFFEPRDPGRYVLAAQRHWGGTILAHQVIELADALVTRDLSIAVLERAGCIEAVARAPDGTVVPDSHLFWRRETGDSRQQDDAICEAREPGVWWLPLDADHSMGFRLLDAWPARTRLWLVARAPDWGETMAEVWPSSRAVELRYATPATLTVHVAGLPDDDERRVRVSLAKRGTGIEAWGGNASGNVDRDKRSVRLGPIAPGPYKVTLWVHGNGRNGWGSSEAGALDVHLASGPNEASLALSLLHSLTLRLPAGTQGGLQLERVGPEGQRRNHWSNIDVTGAQPVATWSDLVEGDYRVHLASGERPGVMQLRVPQCGTSIDWEPMEVNALRVRMYPTPGELAGLGFEEGDLVTAIDGRDVTSFVDLQILWTLARAQRRIPLTVVRRGEARTLEVEGTRIANQGKLGGTFDPATR